MTFLAAPPRFQPRPMLSGFGWEILVTWQNGGETDIVDGFADEREAEAWIDRESASWEYHRQKN